MWLILFWVLKNSRPCLLKEKERREGRTVICHASTGRHTTEVCAPKQSAHQRAKTSAERRERDHGGGLRLQRPARNAPHSPLPAALHSAFCSLLPASFPLEGILASSTKAETIFVPWCKATTIFYNLFQIKAKGGGIVHYLLHLHNNNTIHNIQHVFWIQ